MCVECVFDRVCKYKNKTPMRRTPNGGYEICIRFRNRLDEEAVKNGSSSITKRLQ